MYAIIAHGGKQYRVAPGDVLRLERAQGAPAEKGSSIDLGQVLMVGRDGGEVVLGEEAGRAKVTATVIGHDRAPKVLIFKKKRRKQYRRTNGHRQGYTEVRVERIG